MDAVAAADRILHRPQRQAAPGRRQDVACGSRPRNQHHDRRRVLCDHDQRDPRAAREPWVAPPWPRSGGLVMSDATSGVSPAGWYRDPHGEPIVRWWDGTTWTEETGP